MKKYRLPLSGEYTDNYDLYFSEWDKIILPIIEELGWQVRGMDPGVSFWPGKEYGQVIELSLDAAKQLSLYIQKQRVKNGEQVQLFWEE